MRTPPRAPQRTASPLLLSRDQRQLGDRLYARAHRGELVAVRPGVYAPADWWADLKPYERYRERVHAAVLAFPDALFFRESAAALHGLPLFGEASHIHLFDGQARATTTFGDVVVHASKTPRAAVRMEGEDALATGLLETIVDTARALPPAYGLALVDAALHMGVSLDALSAIVASDSNRRGTRKLAWAFEFADARSESVGESVSRAVIHWLGFPVPTLQQRFWSEGREDRTDFWWPDHRIIGESDGYGKYAATRRPRQYEPSSRRSSAKIDCVVKAGDSPDGTGAMPTA